MRFICRCMNPERRGLAVVVLTLASALLLSCGGGSGRAADTRSLTVFAGTPSGLGSVDGMGAGARFRSPGAVAVDAAGNAYVADTENSAIRKVTPAGTVSTLAGTVGRDGAADATGTSAQFTFPEGIAVDGAGNVYVADTYNSTIRKVTSTGAVSTLAGTARKLAATMATAVRHGSTIPTVSPWTELGMST